MLIETAPVDQQPSPWRIRSLELIVAMGIATLIAPLAAPASILIVFFLTHGDFGGSLLMLVLAPMAVFTAPGFYGYVMAFSAVSVLGTAMTLLALHHPRLRPIWIWTAIGALFGMVIASFFAPVEPFTFLYGTAAGGSCAFLYRLIVARPLAAHRTAASSPDCPTPDADLD